MATLDGGRFDYTDEVALCRFTIWFHSASALVGKVRFRRPVLLDGGMIETVWRQ